MKIKSLLIATILSVLFVSAVSAQSKDTAALQDLVKQVVAAQSAFDAGTLESARAMERLTLLAVGINRRYKKKSARYDVVGL